MKRGNVCFRGKKYIKIRTAYSPTRNIRSVGMYVMHFPRFDVLKVISSRAIKNQHCERREGIFSPSPPPLHHRELPARNENSLHIGLFTRGIINVWITVTIQNRKITLFRWKNTGRLERSRAFCSYSPRYSYSCRMTKKYY